MALDVFISYSRENRDIADRIAQDLRHSGFRVYYAKELLPGEAWGQKLEQQLRSARHILVLLSPSYVRSRWAQKELEMASLLESKGAVRIVPVLIEDTDIPLFLRSKHYADLRASYEAGIAHIKKALTVAPEVSEVSRARHFRWSSEVAGVLLGLLGVVTGSISVAADAALADYRVVSVVVGVVAGLTAFIAFVSAYRPRQRSKPIQIVSLGIEQAYFEALEQSGLNPSGIQERSVA